MFFRFFNCLVFTFHHRACPMQCQNLCPNAKIRHLVRKTFSNAMLYSMLNFGIWFLLVDRLTFSLNNYKILIYLKLIFFLIISPRT